LVALRSATATRAPSRAKRIDMARPLPMGIGGGIEDPLPADDEHLPPLEPTSTGRLTAGLGAWRAYAASEIGAQPIPPRRASRQPAFSSSSLAQPRNVSRTLISSSRPANDLHVAAPRRSPLAWRANCLSSGRPGESGGFMACKVGVPGGG